MNLIKFNEINFKLDTKNFVFIESYLVIYRSNKIEFIDYENDKLFNSIDFHDELIFLDNFFDNLNNEKILLINKEFKYSIIDSSSKVIEYKDLNCKPKLFSRIFNSHLLLINFNDILIDWDINNNFNFTKTHLKTGFNYIGIEKFEIYYILYNNKEIHIYNNTNIIKKFQENINKLKIFENKMILLWKSGELLIYENFIENELIKKRNLKWHSYEISDICYDYNNNIYYTGGKEGVLVEWKNNFSKKDFLPRFEDFILNLKTKNNFIAVGLKNKIIIINNFKVINEFWGISETPNILTNKSQVLLFNKFNQDLKILNIKNNSINTYNLNTNNFINKNKFLYEINNNYLCILEKIGQNFNRIKFFDLNEDLKIINFIRYSFSKDIIYIKFINDILVTISNDGNIILFKKENNKFDLFSVFNLNLENIKKILNYENKIILITKEEIIIYDVFDNNENSIFYNNSDEFKDSIICGENIIFLNKDNKLYLYQIKDLKLINKYNLNLDYSKFHEINSELFIIEKIENNKTLFMIIDKNLVHWKTLEINKILEESNISFINNQIIIINNGLIYFIGDNIFDYSNKLEKEIINNDDNIPKNSKFSNLNLIQYDFSKKNKFKNINLLKESNLIPNFKIINNEIFEMNLIKNN